MNVEYNKQKDSEYRMHENQELSEIMEFEIGSDKDVQVVKPDIQYIENTSVSALLEQNRLSEQNTPEKYDYKGDADENKRGGLSEEEKAKVREKHSDWPDEIIDAISSWEEYEIYDKANLRLEYINGKPCLIRSDIGMEQKDADGLTNRQRMERGLPPITKDGKTVELHHIGQKSDSPLAELTTDEHRGTGNDTILHDKTKESEIDRNEFAKERREHWKSRTSEN